MGGYTTYSGNWSQVHTQVNLFNPKWILDVGKMSSSQSALEWIVYKGKMSQEQITEGRRLAIEEEDKHGARSIKLVVANPAAIQKKVFNLAHPNH